MLIFYIILYYILLHIIHIIYKSNIKKLYGKYIRKIINKTLLIENYTRKNEDMQINCNLKVF